MPTELSTLPVVAALRRLGEQRPQGLALQYRRLGRWYGLPWRELLALVEAARLDPRSLDPGAGDAAVAVGALNPAPTPVLNPAFVIALLADAAAVPVRALARAPSATGTSRVFAEFDPAWAPGVDWLTGDWLRAGATLVLPEPGGDAVADRREARADGWLAQPERVRTLLDTLNGRLAPAGLSRRLALDALAGSQRLPARLARWRLRTALGLADARQLLGVAPADVAVQQALSGLGLRLPQAAAAAAADPASPVGQVEGFGAAALPLQVAGAAS